MYIWYVKDIINSLKKNRDRIVWIVRTSDGLIILNTQKGYRYEMDANDYSENVGILFNK